MKTPGPDQQVVKKRRMDYIHTEPENNSGSYGKGII